MPPGDRGPRRPRNTMKTKTREIGRGGRPAKFDEPSHPVTITLPDRILKWLEAIDADRAKAVVKAVETALSGSETATGESVGELRVAKDETLLVVPKSRLLAAIPWLTLVEIAPGRNLLSLQDAVTIEKLEVTLGDLIDSHPEANPVELRILRTLQEKIRAPRRNQAVRTEEILVVRDLPARR